MRESESARERERERERERHCAYLRRHVREIDGANTFQRIARIPKTKTLFTTLQKKCVRVYMYWCTGYAQWVCPVGVPTARVCPVGVPTACTHTHLCVIGDIPKVKLIHRIPKTETLRTTLPRLCLLHHRTCMFVCVCIGALSIPKATWV